MTFKCNITIEQYYADNEFDTDMFALSFKEQDETWHCFLPRFRQALAGAGFIFDPSWELQMVNTNTGEQVVPLCFGDKDAD